MKTRLPVNSPRMAFAATFAWLFAENPDFGIEEATDASPKTWILESAFDAIVAGTIGAQSPSVTPALCAIMPAL